MEPHSRKVEELINRYVPPGSRVLDVGCGTGINTSRLKNKTREIIGFDVTNYVKDQYRQDFKFVLGKKDQLPFPNNYFDLVTCWDVIEHIEKDVAFCQELYRVLRYKGLLMMSTPNKNRLSNRLLRLIREIRYPYCLGEDKDGGGAICHVREYTMKELNSLAINTRFKIRQTEGVYLGFHGFIRFGLFKVPKILQNWAQHLFLVLTK